MNKYKETFGVDISKDVFDVHGSNKGHDRYKNDEPGFRKFLKESPEGSLVVMEATGHYHYRLAQFLHKNGVIVSVVNPLSIKRFVQMKLAKVKTDRSDAKAICEYALINEVPLYNALTDTQSECLQLFRLLDTYLKQRTATKNKIHGEAVLGIPSKFVHRSLVRNRKQLDKEVAAIESKILSLVKLDQQEQLTLLTSIPGIGQKTALFLCSFNACKHNRACKEVYERIVNKGKSKKLALIAVANKLLKQSFAIARSGRPYDETYVSTLPR
jgi:transposase